MIRVVFIVEGDSEIIFIDKVVIPYLYTLGFTTNPMHCQSIITNRKQHKKGGVGSFGKFKNEISRTLAQGNVLVTTLIDFYGLPTDFPGFSSNASGISTIEREIHKAFNYTEYLIPYIQKHELESLMFADRNAIQLVLDDSLQLEKIDGILKEFPNPEDINNSWETAPSKRLQKILDYDKTADGNIVFEEMKIDDILHKCPRFKCWIDSIVKKLVELNKIEE